jgi:hypothetical protein
MVQVPTEISVTVEPETVQTEKVVDLKLTGRPELAVAGNATATDVLTTWGGIAANVIVWVSGVTVKLCVTAGAAA